MLISIQLDPLHWGPNYANAIKAMQPKSIRMINGSASRLEEMRKLVPGALFTIRQHALSEEQDEFWADPEGTAKRHAATLIKLAKGWGLTGSGSEQYTYVGLNEPAFWRQADGIKRVVAYNVRFLRDLTDAGLRGLALSMNTGWPQDMGQGKGSPVNWEPFVEVLQFLSDHPQHFLATHEYWPREGPQPTPDLKPAADGGPWGWNPGRTCCWLDKKKWAGVSILIGECGMNASVGSGMGNIPQNKQGWKNWLKRPEEYAAQILAYDKALQSDPRVHSAQLFLLDGTSAHWGSTTYLEVMPHLGRNKEFSFYSKVTPASDEKPVVEIPEPENNLHRSLRAVGRNAQLIMLNREAALQKRIAQDGLVPVSNEFIAAYEGKNYVVQRAEDLVSGVGYTYFAMVNEWDRVFKIRD